MKVVDTSLFLTVQLLILLQQVAMAHLSKEIPHERDTYGVQSKISIQLCVIALCHMSTDNTT